MAVTGGWAERLGGEILDERRSDPIAALRDLEAVREWLTEVLP